MTDSDLDVLLDVIARARRPEEGLRVWVPEPVAVSFLSTLATRLAADSRFASVRLFVAAPTEAALDAMRSAVMDRTHCIFARHDFLKAPPLSRIDLVCFPGARERFGDDERRKALLRLHYALRPNGILACGPLEESDAGSLFCGEGLPAGCYRRVQADVPLSYGWADELGSSRAEVPAAWASRRRRERLARHVAEQHLLARFAPPSVMVDEDFAIREGVGGRVPHLSTRELPQNLLTLVSPPEAAALRALLETAKREDRSAHWNEWEILPLDGATMSTRHYLVVSSRLAMLQSGEARAAASARNVPGRLDALVVEADGSDLGLLAKLLVRDGVATDFAACASDAFRRITTRDFGLVLANVETLGADAGAFLKALARQSHRPVFVVTTTAASLDAALEAFRSGALDYLAKPLREEDVRPLLERAVRYCRARPFVSPRPPVPSTGALVGKTKRMVEVYRLVAKAAASEANVLITGETGTGKGRIAQAIHANSCRHAKPFITVNCGAIVETLLESELFGHVRGAFTGALCDRAGLFEAANGGTLFLDEIGDVSHGLQVKLLRVVQEGEIRRVGGTETRKIDVRLIAATHRDLSAMIREGTFREDLYYRLKVIPLDVPPLRERLSDLPELIESTVERFAAKLGRAVPAISGEAIACLYEYAWPGNIRELEHALEHALAMSRADVLYPEDLPRTLQQGQATIAQAPPQEPALSVDSLERQRLIDALQSVNFNKSKAASLLGISRVTLYRKAERYGIH